MAQWNGIEYSGDLAHVIEETPDKDLAFFDYIDDLSDQIYIAMEDKGWSKADLARATGKSRSWVTQVLSGDNNMTMKTFVHLLFAMGMKAQTHIVVNEYVKCSYENINKQFGWMKDARKLHTYERLKQPSKAIPFKLIRGKEIIGQVA